MRKCYGDDFKVRIEDALVGDAKITLEQQKQIAEEIKQWLFDPQGNLITKDSDKKF